MPLFSTFVFDKVNVLLKILYKKSIIIQHCSGFFMMSVKDACCLILLSSALFIRCKQGNVKGFSG